MPKTRELLLGLVRIRPTASYSLMSDVGSPDLASKYNPKFKTSISAGDASTHLSGIIFLRDDLIMSTVPAQVNVDATFAWNANALNPLAGHPFDTALRALGARELN